jgi:peptide/nickel transport system permease protein
MTIVEDPTVAVAVPARPDQARVARRERLRLLVRSPTFVIGCLLFGAWVVCALFGSLIAPQDPQFPDVLNKLAPPSSEHLLGSDRLGRDVLSPSPGRPSASSAATTAVWSTR